MMDIWCTSYLQSYMIVFLPKHDQNGQNNHVFMKVASLNQKVLDENAKYRRSQVDKNHPHTREKVLAEISYP